MNSDFIIHLFASLQYLEKCLTKSKKMLIGKKDLPFDLRINISQQTRILMQMRRAANNLQLFIAKGNDLETHRELQVFYGLHHMIRSEVINTCQKLTKTSLVGPNFSAQQANTYTQQFQSFH